MKVLSAGSKPPVFLNGNVIAENNLIKFQDISSKTTNAVALLLELRKKSNETKKHINLNLNTKTRLGLVRSVATRFHLIKF